MQLTPAQQQIASDLHRFRVVNCGRRFGKTTLAIDQIKACAGYRESRIAYIAPTFQQARDIAWEELKRDCKQAAIAINESRLEIRLANQFGTESLIILRGWESIETLRGQLFDLIVLDEVASMRNFWRSWEEVVRPTLTDRKGEVLFISTPKGFNHFYDLFNLEAVDIDFKSFHFTSYDNPHIPPDEIDKAKSQLTDTRFCQEYLADFRKTEGLVYKDFNREQHVVDELPTMVVETLGGIDFGHVHPAAVLTVKRDYDGVYWLTDEWYRSGQTEEQIVDYVVSSRFNKVYPDPENASAIEAMRRKGVNIREVNKGKGSIVSGISKVQELLKQNRLRVHKSCLNTIQEFETYSYPDGPQPSELPLKEGDDAMDALRYVLMSEIDMPTSLAPRIHYSEQRRPVRRIA